MAQTTTPQLTLEVATPGRQPYRVTLHKTQNIVGRESGDIVLNDPEASAIHAEIDTTSGHVVVRDLGSSNGTWRAGERLPHFALYEGQSFHCGNTEIRLVAISGPHESIQPGQTAVGQTQVKERPSSPDTLLGGPNTAPSRPPPGWSPPSPLTLGSPAPVAEDSPERASSTLPGPYEPSASPTVPGVQPSSSSTLPAPAAPSSGTLPGPAGSTSATPSSATLPTTPESTASPANSARPQPESTPPPQPHAPTTPQPDASSQAGPAPRAPVANAVIKPKGAATAPPNVPRAPRPERKRRLVGTVLISAVVAAALAGAGYLLFGWLTARALDFVETVAEEVPNDAIGFVALRSVDDAVALVEDTNDGPWKELRVDAMGFDPFDANAWSEQGVDVSAPLGLALLDPTAPTFAVSFGVADRDKLVEALHTQLPRLLGARPDANEWSERTFGDAEGSWSEAQGVALVHRGDRTTVVFTPRAGWSDDVEAHAVALGSLDSTGTLANSDAFSALTPPPGEPLAVGFVDGASLRGALPADASALMLRLALADLDGFSILVSHENDAIHVVSEVVLREGSRHLEVIGDGKRDAAALRRIAPPVLLELDANVDGAAIDRALGGALTALGQSLPVLEAAVSERLDLDLRADVTQNLSGEIGAALLALPPTSDRGHEVRAVAWLGVADATRARNALERVYDKGFVQQSGAEVAKRELSGTDIYSVEADPGRSRPTLQMLVHEDRVWLLVGPVDPSMVIEGPETNIVQNASHRSIEDAIKKGDIAAGFIDIAGLASSMQPLLDGPDLDALEVAAPLLELLRTTTLRTRREGRVILTNATLHTADDVGLRGLLQALTAQLGERMSAGLARASRASRCATLSEHVVALSRKSLEDAGAPLEAAWEIERSVQEQCNEPSMTTARLDCYLSAESIQGLAACDAKHPARATASPEPSKGASEQPEPKVVPYVDDIWPHRVDDPDSDSPQPDVNYAVPTGPSPETRGPDDALVTIVMFGDFECEHCKAVVGTVDEVLAEHGDEVRLVYRHLPLENIHPSATAAARAALAASQQGSFWAMHDALFDRSARLDAAAIDEAARASGLDMVRYETDRASVDVQRRLQRDIEVAAKFGVRGTPAFFVNGRYLGGRQSVSAFNAVVNEEIARARMFVERRGQSRKRLYEDMSSHFAPEVIQPQTAVALPPEDAKRYTVSTEGLPRKGAETFARVEIVECGDFDCPFCARTRKALDQTLDAYPSVTLFFAHNPVDYHPGAEPAARAAYAAQVQGKFWEMHDRLFEDQRSNARTDADYLRYAARLGLDLERFERDFSSKEAAAAVAAQQTLCTDNDGTSTPTFFINGRRVRGAQSAEQLAALVDAELSTGI